MAKNKENWKKKSDEWLLQVLCDPDVDAQEQALIQLQQRYDRQIKQMVRRKVRSDWVEDANQEIWKGIFQSVRRNQGKVVNVGGYLYAVAKYRIADIVDRLTCEDNLEHDRGTSAIFDIEELSREISVEEEVLREEEQVVACTQLEFVQLVPFVDSVLSDCQRVIWLLARLLGYPQTVVTRLMGKKYATIRSEYRHAHNKLLKYFQSDEFAYLLEDSELPKSLRFATKREASVVVERFAEMTTPRLTPDELKPLGLTPEEFEQQYVASLIMPRWFETQTQMELNLPSILLTRRSQWPDLGIHLQKLYQGTNSTEYTPLECLIHFSIDDDNIILKPTSLMEMIPELNPIQWTDNTFVTAHAPRMTVPVIWGFWDESMVNDNEAAQEYIHWPFMRSLGNEWVDFRGQEKS